MGRTLGEKIKVGIKNPALAGRIINRTLRPAFRRWNHADQGVQFFDEDWDNLIILDACRFDTFRNLSNISGQLNSKISNASNTVEFLENNFDGRDLLDTVYVTANGQISNYSDSLDLQLHAVNPLYSTAWDDDIGTVPASSVVKAAKNAAKEYPNKRLVIHFVQPHIPFVRTETTDDKNRHSEFPFWVRYRMGETDLTEQEIREGYKDNLDYVLPHVEELLKTIDGKSVVTSDHGNIFGERTRPIPFKEWGHPKGVFAEELVRVPWLEYPYTTRREIIAEDGPGLKIESDPATVEDRLRALGYR